MILSTLNIGSEINLRIENLKVWIDFAQSNCYPKTGTSIKNLTSFFFPAESVGATFNINNGGVFTFNGVNQTINFSEALTNITKATFIVWLKPNGNQVNFATIWLSRGANTLGVIYSDTGVNNWAIIWNNSQFRTTAGNIPINKWSMIAVSISNTSYRTFVYNNVDTGFKNSINFTTTNANFSSPKLGFDSSFTGRRFVGDIAISMFYDTNLSDDEITKIYLTNKSRFI
jgi:hypothetical protein